jgi:hypothetical protein
MLEGLVEATSARNRRRLLESVNLKLDKLRFLFRLFGVDQIETPCKSVVSLM